jgi:lipopolysaccharide export system protein LptC
MASMDFNAADKALPPPKRLDRAMYRAAMRHTRFIQFLRFIIPFGSIVTIVAIAVIAIFDPFGRLPKGVSIGAINFNGSQITMELPKLTGFRRDLRPYEVTASAARQDIRNPSVIDLSDLKARIGMGAQGTALLVAQQGIYDSTKETLKLAGDVNVRTGDGIELKMKSAFAEFKTGAINSQEPVEVQLQDGIINANGIEIIEGGQEIIFLGRVRTVFSQPPLQEQGTKP